MELWLLLGLLTLQGLAPGSSRCTGGMQDAPESRPTALDTWGGGTRGTGQGQPFGQTEWTFGTPRPLRKSRTTQLLEENPEVLCAPGQAKGSQTPNLQPSASPVLGDMQASHQEVATPRGATNQGLHRGRGAV